MDLPDTAPALEEQSAPTVAELPPQRSRPAGLFFRSPSPSDPPSPPAEESPDLGDGSPSASGSESPAPEWSTDDPTSSPTFSAEPDPASRKPLSTRALRPMFRNGVLIGSGVAHRFGARTEGQQRAGLFLADDEDAAAIGDPLAAIAARREGIAGKVSPDTADFIQSMMGVAGYLSKQIVASQAAQAYDAQRSGQPVQTIPTDEAVS